LEIRMALQLESRRLVLGLFGLCVGPWAAQAATVTLSSSDAPGTSSFAAAGNWSNFAPPSAGNDYLVAVQMRTPTSGSGSFAGDSLTLNPGGSILPKSPGPWQIDNLILAGGQIVHGDVGGSQIFTLNGGITVTAPSNINTPAPNARHIVLNALLGGSANLTVSGSNTAGLNGTVTFANAANSWNGALTANNRAILVVDSVANGGVNSPLGSASSAAANLVLNNATLRYTGAATTSTDRLFTLGNGGATLQASGSGTAAVQFLNPGALAFTGSGARALNLTGANGGENTFAPVLGNNGSDVTSLVVGASGGTVKTGRWIVSGANTFTGNVSIHEGALQITQAASLGSGTKTIVMTNGTNGEPQLILDGSGGNIHLPASMAFQTSTSANGAAGIRNLAGNNSIAGAFSLASGGGDTRFVSDGGTLLVSGNLTFVSGSRNVNLAGASSGTLSGNILNGGQSSVGLVKHGAGTWTISGTGNNYNSNTSIVQGTLRLGASNVLPHGAGTGNVSLAPVASTTATLDLNGFNEAVNGLASSGAGSAFVNNAGAGAATLTVGDANNTQNTTFNGVIQNTGGNLALTKTGNGTLTLGGPNTFSGNVVVNDGILSLTHSSALGAVGKTVSVVGNSGASPALVPELRLQGGLAIQVGTLVTSGAGVGAGSGVIRNISGDNSITATTAITLTGGNGSTTIQSDAGTLTLNGDIAPNTTLRGLVLQGAGDGEITGSINNGVGANVLTGVTKNGSGMWTLSNPTSGHTSKTAINGGILRLTSGSEATLGNPAAAADALSLNGGTLQVSTSSLAITNPNRGLALGAAGGTFLVDGSLSLSVANGITGSSGQLNKAGAGTFNLTGGVSTPGSLSVQQGVFAQSAGELAAPSATIAPGATYRLQGGRLRLDNLTATGGFEWGNGGRLSHFTTGTSLPIATDLSSPGFQEVGVGRTATVTGDLAAGDGAILALNNSPTLYQSFGIRYNNFHVAGALALAGLNDELELELNPYLLRPFSTLGPLAEEYGSLPLITWTGAWDGNTFDQVSGIADDGRGFSPSTFAVSSGSALDVNTYFLEYDGANQTLWFHYKVSGYVPEPDTFALLALSLLGLRTGRALRDRRRRLQIAAP
jgi:fibronectin-binding autotransporter adhesin